MRAIKLRAWNQYAEYEGEMVSETNSGLTSAQIFGRFKNIMQYTGLKDMNGKEIYEGDIIAYGSLGQVVFHQESASFGFVGMGEPVILENMRWFANDLGSDECEVIGNSYENPELLMEAKPSFVKMTKMRYIILTKDHPPFYTKWFDYENHWQEGMTVIDLTGDAYTTNGKEWQKIEFDHL